MLGDWNQLRLYVREDVRLDVDAGGELFTKNQAVVRADQLEGFVTVEEAAEQMGITEQRVHQHVRNRMLRSAYHGPGMLVQPAITNR